jgi:hypothetical protein
MKTVGNPVIAAPVIMALFMKRLRDIFFISNHISFFKKLRPA